MPVVAVLLKGRLVVQASRAFDSMPNANSGRRRRTEWDYGGGRWQWRPQYTGRPSQISFKRIVLFLNFSVCIFTSCFSTTLHFCGLEMLSVTNCPVPGWFCPECQETVEQLGRLQRPSRGGSSSQVPYGRGGAVQPCLPSPCSRMSRASHSDGHTHGRNAKWRLLEPLDRWSDGHASWNGVRRLHRRASRNSSITLPHQP